MLDYTYPSSLSVSNTSTTGAAQQRSKYSTSINNHSDNDYLDRSFSNISPDTRTSNGDSLKNISGIMGNQRDN